MSEAIDEEKLDEFCQQVEEKTGQEPLPDPHMGDICWFFFDVELEIEGQKFEEVEADFNLSRDDVELLYSEIRIPHEDDRKPTLDDAADQLDKDSETYLYDYYPEESDIEGVMEDLRDVHSEVYQ